MNRNKKIFLAILVLCLGYGIAFDGGSDALAAGGVVLYSAQMDRDGESVARINKGVGDVESVNEVVRAVKNNNDIDSVLIECVNQGMLPVLIDGINVDDGVTEFERNAMLYNTYSLQNQISCAKNGSNIMLPEGVFYFVSGQVYMAVDSKVNGNDASVERHVISFYKESNDGVQRDVVTNVTIAGAYKNAGKTELKPYDSGEEEYSNNARLIKDGRNKVAPGGIDMFFFNDLSAYGSDAPRYLTGLNFRNFTINSDKTAGYKYNTSGKGFMMNLIDNCHWDNVVVKNTDGTGFGVDSPKNSGISNSRAIGNGKGIWANHGGDTDVAGAMRGGGSGFGIGTGYSDGESFVIEKSVAEGNGLFGFFYEHQGRFGPEKYLGTSGDFKFVDTESEGNYWNYGGMRANDVEIVDSESVLGQNYAGKNTARSVYFSDESRNISTNGGVDIDATVFSDLDKNDYYYDAVLWMEANGLANDLVNFSVDGNWDESRRADNFDTVTTFGPNSGVTRADAISLIWRMMGRPGNTVSRGSNPTSLNADNGRYLDIKTCFEDVKSYRTYAGAVQWALVNGVTNGVSGDCRSDGHGGYTGSGIFGGEEMLTRAQFVTMLYRLENPLNSGGSTNRDVGDVEEFVDVTDRNAWYYDAVMWAVKNKITNGVGDNKFAPDGKLTRAQMAAMVYRYWNKYYCGDSGGMKCADPDVLLDVNHNRK